jgi:RNA polymerase sigma factor (sigma-70 family)
MATAAPELPVLARDLAFERLYRRYVKDVYQYALALLRNPADAEDVTQQTFLNAYRAFKRGEEPLKPHNWLIKIAHNAARTRYARSARRVKEVPLEEHVEALAAPEDEKPDVQEVLRALGRLPLNQRAALVMRELEGRSYAEIAETIGVSVPAVETLIFRARRSLRLKSSAVRALGVVQLPPSLLQFFGGGSGALVGGGAAAGTGLLVKAAVAVVAGAVATGVVGADRGGRVEAADVDIAIAAPPWSARAPLAPAVPRLVRTGPQPHARAAGKPVSAGPGVASRRRFTHGEEPASDVAAGTAPAEPGRAAPAAVSPQPVATSTVADVTKSPVTTVEQAVPPLPVAVPAPPPLPPVPQVPDLPPVPLPPPPPVPGLP